MKSILPHITVGIGMAGEVIIVVNDTELADFIDDYLCEECDFPPACVTERDRPGGKIVTLHFLEGPGLAVFEDLLSVLSLDYMNEIFELNNPAATSTM